MNDSSHPDFGKQVKALFDLCVDKPQTEQQQIIINSDASEAIKNRVKSLLSHSEDNQLDLTQAVIQKTQNNTTLLPLQPNLRIDEFSLDSPLGQGGQGEVWKAHRNDGQFNQEVAIKFLKPVYTDKDLSRFNNERDFLAALKHNNIAHLIGGGEFENRPFIIMEWVDGQPLLDYCQQQKASLETRLDYFLQICDAISYAHMNRVIHRDIKPSNVLITQDKVVKLLDFGIAKTLVGSFDTEQTETAITMTLAYSSPEQVTGEPVSTATDVYTLGLFLFELLTGQRAQGSQSEIPASIIKEITSESPVLPSRVESKINDYLLDYNLDQLSGDLDNLIMKAVSKEPERRYGSVQAMADDVQSFLQGKPLTATGDSWVYKTKKLIKRNPVGSTLALVAMALLIALPAVLLFYQQQVQTERDKAQQQATIAQRSNAFLTTLLRSASPLGANSGDILLKDVLKLAEFQIADGLNDQPLIKAPLLVLLGDIHNNLKQYEQAIEYYQQALTLYEKENDVQGKIFALGQLGFVFYENSQLTESNGAMAQSYQLFNSAKDLDPGFQTKHLSRKATMLNYTNDPELARDVINRALDIIDVNQIENYHTLGRLYNELALSYIYDDDELAVKYMDQAIKYGRKVNKNNPFVYFRQSTKANALNRLGRQDEALKIMDEGKKGIARLYSENHPHYANIIKEEAYIYHDLGQYDQTESLYKKAMSIYQITNSNQSIRYILQLNNLAYLYEDMRRFNQAEPLYRESLSKRREFYSSEPMRVASNAANLARLLAKMNQFNEAKTLLNEAMPVYTTNKRSNLYNHITNAAITIGAGSPQSCQQGLKQTNKILPELNQVAENSWRRMQAELWLGQLASKCNEKELAEQMVNAALQKSKNIYKAESQGQKLIAEEVELALASIHSQ